jgi:peptide/nickel transport system substrate-binding protein
MKRRLSASIAAAGLLALSACSTSTTQNDDADGGGDVLTVGTTDKVTKIDPAGSYDNGSTFVENQVYAYLVEQAPGSSEVEPSIAESAEFTDATTYTVKLKDGLTFANGHELTSSDVKFSFDRQKTIADPNGPSSLLGSLDSVETPDDSTIVFTLNRADQTFPQILASAAGPIVDEEVFSADSLTDDADIVAAKAFAGPYTITSYQFNKLVSYSAFDGYQGLLGKPATSTVNMTYYTDANNMKLDISSNKIDVAWRSMSATDIADLETNDEVAVHQGPGGEIRYIVFNFDTMPFGAASDAPDAAKALAVRQAMADSVDREAIAEQVYKGTYTPLYSYLPDGLAGANESLKEAYGDGSGGADVDKAKAVLTAAGVTGPVDIKLQYNPDHYGSSSGEEYALIKQQLEDTGLFTVDLQSTEWVQYSKDRSSDVYPVYQLGWFPDYSDGDNYLTPFFYDTDESASFLANHFRDEAINAEIEEQVTLTDADERAAMIGKIQNDVAALLPTLPLLQGSQVAVSGTDVKGVDDTLDASFRFRLATLSK